MGKRAARRRAEKLTAPTSDYRSETGDVLYAAGAMATRRV